MCWSQGGAMARIVYLKSYVSEEEALSDLDVSKNPLEPISP
jgi:hypothetical protein